MTQFQMLARSGVRYDEKKKQWIARLHGRDLPKEWPSDALAFAYLQRERRKGQDQPKSML